MNHLDCLVSFHPVSNNVNDKCYASGPALPAYTMSRVRVDSQTTGTEDVFIIKPGRNRKLVDISFRGL
jgi:hypothetical protein